QAAAAYAVQEGPIRQPGRARQGREEPRCRAAAQRARGGDGEGRPSPQDNHQARSDGQAARQQGGVGRSARQPTARADAAGVRRAFGKAGARGGDRGGRRTGDPTIVRSRAGDDASSPSPRWGEGGVRGAGGSDQTRAPEPPHPNPLPAGAREFACTSRPARTSGSSCSRKSAACLTPTEYNALLRQDFCAFVQRCFHELYPQSEFLWNWHIEVMAAKLANCFRQKIRRLIVNIPPRHLKSLCASVALPAWWLGHDCAAQILCVSYGQELADKHARDCRAVMASAFYQRIFPARLSAQKQSVQEFVTSAGGFRFATSVGGVLTGRGGDVVIIDDPLKPDEALSEAERKAVNEW